MKNVILFAAAVAAGLVACGGSPQNASALKTHDKVTIECEEANATGLVAWTLTIRELAHGKAMVHPQISELATEASEVHLEIVELETHPAQTVYATRYNDDPIRVTFLGDEALGTGTWKNADETVKFACTRRSGAAPAPVRDPQVAYDALAEQMNVVAGLFAQGKKMEACMIFSSVDEKRAALVADAEALDLWARRNLGEVTVQSEIVASFCNETEQENGSIATEEQAKVASARAALAFTLE